MTNRGLFRSEKHDDQTCNTKRRAFLHRATVLVAGTKAATLLKAEGQQSANTSTGVFDGFKPRRSRQQAQSSTCFRVAKVLPCSSCTVIPKHT